MAALTEHGDAESAEHLSIIARSRIRHSAVAGRALESATPGKKGSYVWPFVVGNIPNCAAIAIAVLLDLAAEARS